MKKLIYSVLKISFLLFVLNAVVLGQTTQKKIPKSRTLPTTQTKQDTTIKEPQKERMELPEVLILGKNMRE